MKNKLAENLFVGTASWGIPKFAGMRFPGDDTQLERYSRVLSGVEINSSFYKEHMPKTYEKWAENTPDNFAFSVKLSRLFTHQQKLDVEEAELRQSLEGIKHLGDKLRVLLVQLPPSLKFDAKRGADFFKMLRKHYNGPVVFEPRHTSWVTPAHQSLIEDFEVSFVVPDPNPLAITEATSSLDKKTCYFRLHGSPDIYKSKYTEEYILELASRIKVCIKKGATVWCIFDNTQYGHATENALELTDLFSSTQLRASTEVFRKTEYRNNSLAAD